MEVDHSRIQYLLEHLAESLNVEVKRWIDIDKPDGAGKVVRGVLALRNRNGGFFVVGFDDKTLQPDISNEPTDPRAAFHVDKVQALVSRYSHDLFEVGVAYGKLQGREYPVIVVPEGIRTPVAAKADLTDGQNQFVRFGAVYFRTLAANGTVSTALIKPQDWKDLIEICFENREADVGRFLRRQLAGKDVATLVAALQQIGAGLPPEALDLIATSTEKLSTSSTHSLRNRALKLLQYGDQRFAKAVTARTLKPDQKRVIESGFWTTALVIEPPRTGQLPDQVFRATLAANNPQYTGWPVWLDSTGFRDETTRPVVTEKGLEALIISLEGWSRHVDFMRLDPTGQFYLSRNLPDDVSDKVKPGILLDPIIAVIRVAEAIAVGLAFAKALGCDPQSTRLGFAFRWTKLKGRKLETWANPLVLLSAYESAHDDEVTTFVELSLDTPASAIAPFVDQATSELFVLFGGYKLPAEAIEHWVQRLIERKL